MCDILNINEDKPTAQQTWNNLYNIQEKDWKKDIYVPNENNKVLHSTVVSNLFKPLLINQKHTSTIYGYKGRSTMHIL